MSLDRLTTIVENNLENKTFLLGLIKYWPGLALLAKSDGTVLAASSQWEEQTGISQRGFKDHGWMYYVHPEDKEVTRKESIDRENRGLPAIGLKNRVVCGDKVTTLQWTTTAYVGPENVALAVASVIS